MENARSQVENRTPLAVIPASTRRVYSPASSSTSSTATRFRYAE